ncbi:glycerophosphoryl diester phosphodiesterase family protein [Nocardiopsis sp. Huas11]|uniref:glycerophosphoryl diester phosphodiesterase membrane domain-containing protein n=1 Tax=Nocardiopsis sp. Huas11 TaxID=2183912 RepID=UPI000EB05337|nr:glycerophosphoryl diester phosphodiesterase membrane domain-containing protein [Nocardiopsis sp. Huas11]RKS05357.1 glycerophosphoryl diester phosphodiesterase family protein [Nocardiopsis sp. Huas11]
MTQEDGRRDEPEAVPERSDEERTDSPGAAATEGGSAADPAAHGDGGTASGTPRFAAPGDSGFAAPGATAPEGGREGATTPDHPAEGPRPGFAPPGGSAPGFAAPGGGSSEHAQHGYAPPGGGSSGYAPPGGGTPGFAAPGGDAPGFAAPGGGSSEHAQYGFAPPGGGEYAAAGHPPAAGQWGAPGHAVPGGHPGQGHPPGPGHGGGPGRPPQAPKPGVVALRPMTVGDLLNGAFSLIRHNPKTFVGVSLIVMAVASIVSSVGFGGYMSDYGRFMDQLLADPNSIDPDDPLPFSTWSLVALYGGSLISYAGTIVLTGLLTCAIGLAVLGRKLSPSETWAAAKPRLGAVAGLALLQLAISVGLSVIVFGLIAVGVLIGFALISSGAEGAGAVVMILTVLIGLVGGLVLAAWISVRIYFAMPIVVLERLSPTRALARSWRLTQGSWWRVFGVLLLTLLLVGVVSQLLTTPFTVLSVVPSFLFPGEAWVPVAAGALIYVGTVLISSFTTPFTVGVSTLLYIDLRMRREGLDLKLHTASQAGHEVGPEIYLPERQA